MTLSEESAMKTSNPTLVPNQTSPKFWMAFIAANAAGLVMVVMLFTT